MKKITIQVFAFLAFVCCWQAQSQVNINENFNSGSTGWTGSYLNSPISACDGSSQRDNLYSWSETGNLTSPNLVAASNATDLMISMDYKIINYSGGDGATDWGTAEIQFSLDDGGSWTTVYTLNDVNHTVSADCASLSTSIPAASLPEGSDVKLRVYNTWSTGDYYFIVDNFVAQQDLGCAMAVVDDVVLVPDCTTNTYTLNVTFAEVNNALSVTDGTSVFPLVGDTVTAGPYAFGEAATLEVTHTLAVCDFEIGEYQLDGCPPVNDNCDNATALTVNDDYACGSVTSATNVYATASAQADDMIGATDVDVWFSFVATKDEHRVTVSNVTAVIGTSTDLAYGVYDASSGCNALTLVDDSDPNEFDVSGLTVGTTYLVRVSAYHGVTSSLLAQATFDICIGTAPSCLVPSGLSTENVTDVSADLEWTENNSATSWDIEWGLDNFTPTGTATVAGVTTNPYELTGLSSSTAYDFYVRSNCGGGDYSAWTGPYTFTTLATPPANDLCENAIALACGDSLTNLTTDGATGGTSNSCQGSIGNDVWFSFEGNGGAVEITANSTTSGEEPQIDVYASTDGTCSGFNQGTCDDSFVHNSAGVNPAIASFYAEAGTTYYIAVGAWINNYPDFNFNISLECISCPDPTGLTADAITAESANLEWTESGSATSWDIEWGLEDFTATGTPTITGTTTNPHELTGLSASTSYDYYVRANCGAGDLSEWVGPYTFTTTDLPPACGGAFYDTGSASGNYANNENYTITICPDVVGDAVTVLFNSFIVEGSGSFGTGCYDSLFIYDGSDNTGTPITPSSLGIGTREGAFCWQAEGDGTGDLTGQSITATNADGCLTFVFQSDSSGSYAGWDATVSCATLGTQDYNLNDLFQYYPNPVTNVLNVKAQNSISNVTIYNMLGQEVLRTAPNALASEVDMSNLQTGAYFVKVSIGNTSKTIRVIKN
ncbi:fibronectin type III domain-containing protein [Bizionia sp. KMM 8389]